MRTVCRPSISLPAQQFFMPTPAFVRWLAGHAGGRRIVDCGAGTGHLELALHASGYDQVLSLDLLPRQDAVADVLMMDACRFPFRTTDLVTVCRPCHDAWVGIVLDRTQKCGAELLYVGLPRNLEQDLGEKTFCAARHDVCAGKDGEVVLGFGEPDLSVHHARMTTLVSLPHWDGPQSMYDGGDRWLNDTGGWFYKNSGETVHPETEPDAAPGMR
jgi:hypothetical protein